MKPVTGKSMSAGRVNRAIALSLSEAGADQIRWHDSGDYGETVESEDAPAYGPESTETADEAIIVTLIDVRVLDHMVVGQDEVVSFAERGWI